MKPDHDADPVLKMLERAAKALRWAGTAAHAQSADAEIQVVKECESIANELERAGKLLLEAGPDTQAAANIANSAGRAIGNMIDVYPEVQPLAPRFKKPVPLLGKLRRAWSIRQGLENESRQERRVGAGIAVQSRERAP
jgi:hypothetical protein